MRTRGQQGSDQASGPATTRADVRPSGSRERLHGLDSLRAGALGLGIVLHSLLPFTPGIPWLFADSESTLLALVGIYWIQLFRMVVFMALAGYFARMVLHRRGTASFLKDRGLRLGLPVIVFWPVAVFPLTKIADADPAGAGELQPHPPEGIPEPLLLFPTWHLWFLVVLLQCILIAVLIGGRPSGSSGWNAVSGSQADSGPCSVPRPEWCWLPCPTWPACSCKVMCRAASTRQRPCCPRSVH